MPDIATERVLYALSKLKLLRGEISRQEVEERNDQITAWEEAQAIVANGGGMVDLLAAANPRIRLAALAEVEDMDPP